LLGVKCFESGSAGRSGPVRGQNSIEVGTHAMNMNRVLLRMSDMHVT
jgi:hypothetical protein